MRDTILKLGACLLLAAAASGVLRAADDETWYRTSLAALVAGNALDAHSSWGHRELNPRVASADGTYGNKGLSLKLAYTGGMVVLECAIIHLLPEGKTRNAARRAFTKFNFAAGAAFGGLAARNYAVGTR